MNNKQAEAIEKLRDEHEEEKSKYDRYADIMASDTLKALISFVEQDEEFAIAVLQNSQTFGDCMKSVAKNIRNGISDLEAFKRAVQFYFPGAEIEYQMKLYVNPFELAEKNNTEKQGFKTFSLFDVL